MENPVLRAVRDGAVCMVNPFQCKLLHKKTSLAVLSDERNAAWFNEPEQRGHRRLTSPGPGGSRSGGRSFTASPST